MKQKFESFKITTHVSIYGNLRLSGQRDVVLIIEFWGFIGLQIVRYFLSLLLLLLLHIINRDYLLNFIMLETMPLFLPLDTVKYWLFTFINLFPLVNDPAKSFQRDNICER